MNRAGGCVDDNRVIETEFSDILTSSSCMTLITEIIKYILYHKQQLPYTFDRLKYVVTKKRALQEVVSNKNVTLTNVDRLYRIAEEGFTVLEELFEKTREELLKSVKISEIALLFGGSPLTPKQVYHIHLPEFYCDHIGSQQDRKYLLKFLQTIIQSNQLAEMLTKPMGPTNMYVFLRKDLNNYNNCNLNSWFLPKNKFQIPSGGQHFHIKLSSASSDNHHCPCQRFNIYSDSDTETSPNHSFLYKPKGDSFQGFEGMTEWYQACTTFKGFKDVFLNGVSVSDLWIR